jgi:hypothetical protein
MSILPECQSIQDQIPPVSREIERVLQQIEAAGPNERPQLVQQFRGLTERQRGLQNSLADCIANSIVARFNGTFTIKVAGQQASSPIALRVLLNSAKTVIMLSSFPPMSSTIGSVTVTVTQKSGGSGSYSGGRIVLPLGLHFEASGSLGNSDLILALTTDQPGSPVTPEPFGAVTVVGNGIVRGVHLTVKDAT